MPETIHPVIVDTVDGTDTEAGTEIAFQAVCSNPACGWAEEPSATYDEACDDADDPCSATSIGDHTLAMQEVGPEHAGRSSDPDAVRIAPESSVHYTTRTLAQDEADHLNQTRKVVLS